MKEDRMVTQKLPGPINQKPAWYRSELFWVTLATTVFFAVLVVIQINGNRLKADGNLAPPSSVSLLHGDSACYYLALKDWEAGRLGPKTYIHGIGMGALGYFTGIFQNPFLPWSFVFFAFTNACVWLLLRRLLHRWWALAAYVLIILTVASTDVYISSTNNMTSFALIVYTVLVGVSGRPLGLARGALLGTLYGICFACRYVDPVLLLPLVIYVLLQGVRDERKRCFLGWAGFAALALPWLFFTLYMHHTYLGSALTTPYATKIPYVERIHNGTEGIANHLNTHFFNDTFRNAYQVFIDPRPYARPIDCAGARPLLWSMPYLVLAFPGIWFWWRSRKGGRAVIYVTLASVALFLLFYCSHWAFTAHDLQYGYLRYVAGWYYIAAIGSVLAVKHTALHIGKKHPLKELAIPGGAIAGLLLLIVLFPICDKWYLNFRTYKDKSQWKVQSNTRNPNTAAMIDGNLDTYWVTPNVMTPGQTLIIDFGDVRSVSQVRFNHGDHAETSFPKQLGVFASQSADGNLYPVNAVKSGRQNHIWILYFNGLQCQRLALTVKKPSNDQWLIYECDVLR